MYMYKLGTAWSSCHDIGRMDWERRIEEEDMRLRG